MSADYKAIARRWINLFNTGNLSAADEIVDPSYVMHDLHTPDLGRGPESVKKYVMTYRTAFPGVAVTIDDLFGEGERVAVRWTARGVHKGKLGSIAPTDKSVEIAGIFIARFADGKIAEGWNQWDALGTVQQLGVVTPPFAPFPPGN